MFLLCGVVFCTAVYCTVCLILPSWKKVSGVPDLGWTIVQLVPGRGIGRDRVVGFILWFLEFQQGIEDFFVGHVTYVI